MAEGQARKPHTGSQWLIDSPGHPICLNYWDGLVRFLIDGRIEIESNTVKRRLRPISLSIKDALFAGREEGAENWAMLASLIETCKRHGVNPEALRDQDRQ